MKKIILLTVLLMATGCSTLKQNMWDCYGCLGSLKSNSRSYQVDTGWQRRMVEESEQRDPEMAKKMREAPEDPMDLWYTLDLHKAR